ncbi:hypothetical protein OKW35_004460 [Paraburkholderia sp. MM5477-R1]
MQSLSYLESPLEVFTVIDNTLPSASISTGKTASVALSPSVTKAFVTGNIRFRTASAYSDMAAAEGCEAPCCGTDPSGSIGRQGPLSSIAVIASRTDSFLTAICSLSSQYLMAASRQMQRCIWPALWCFGRDITPSTGPIFVETARSSTTYLCVSNVSNCPATALCDLHASTIADKWAPTKRSLSSTIRSPTLLKQIFRPISRIAILLHLVQRRHKRETA